MRNSLIALIGLVLFASQAYGIPKVQIEKAKLIDTYDLASYPGKVESKINAQIFSDTEGVVTKVLRKIGEKVQKGQGLLVIEHTDPLFQYAPVTVTASVSGVVGQLKVTTGTRVTKGQDLDQITKPDDVKVFIELTASDSQTIKPGQEAEFSTVGSGGEKFLVKVTAISPLVDPVTGTASCEMELVKKEMKAKIFPGSIGQVEFKFNKRKAFVVKEDAVTFKTREPSMRILVDGLAKRIPVTLGRKQEGSYEVLKGLNEGQVYISKTSGFVADGQKVEVEKSEQEKAN